MIYALGWMVAACLNISDDLGVCLMKATPWKFSSNYRKTSSISCTKSQSSNVSCILLQLSSLNPLKPDVKLRMKIELEKRRQAMLQLHLSYQQFYCLRCSLYYRFYGNSPCSLVPGICCGNFRCQTFKHNLKWLPIWTIYVEKSSVECHIITMMLRYVNNGSGNGLVSSGNRLIPKPMLTKFYDVIWHHKQTITQIPHLCCIYVTQLGHHWFR